MAAHVPICVHTRQSIRLSKHMLHSAMAQEAESMALQKIVTDLKGLVVKQQVNQHSK